MNCGRKTQDACLNDPPSIAIEGRLGGEDGNSLMDKGQLIMES